VAPPLKITRLQHIGLPVTDLARSTKFYQGLGFVAVMSSPFERPAGTGHAAMLRQEEIILELYQMPKPELDSIRQRSNGHIDHIAFDVEDIDETFALLQGERYAIVEPAPVFLPFWKQGCRYFNILGPDGERLEFNQIL
jgi:lactoylglutathione lyase